MKKNIFFVILISILFLKCEKEETYSEVPYITFKEFVFDIKVHENDTSFRNPVGILTFDFVDGDGDIGFYENNDTIKSDEIFDILLKEYTKINGDYILTDSSSDNTVLPYFEKGIYRKHLKGEIELTVYLTEQLGDTVQYEFQIMDRAYHLSNIETTSELIVPESF